MAEKPAKDTTKVVEIPEYNFVGIPISHPAARALASIVVEGFEHIDILHYNFEKCWTRVNRDAQYSKDDVVAAIIVSGSDYAGMSTLLGRNRSRIKDYVMSHTDVYEIFLGVEQTFLDLIERIGKVQAVMGDGPMIRFYLQTLGKDRGFTTRVENTGKDGAPLGPDLSAYTDEQLEQLAAIHSAARETGTNPDRTGPEKVG